MSDRNENISEPKDQSIVSGSSRARQGINAVSRSSQNMDSNLMFDDDEEDASDDSTDYVDSPYSELSPSQLEMAIQMSLNPEGSHPTPQHEEDVVVGNDQEEHGKLSNFSTNSHRTISTNYRDSTQRTITNLNRLSDDEDNDEFEFSPPLPPKKRYLQSTQAKRNKKRLKLSNQDMRFSSYDNVSNPAPKKPLPPTPEQPRMMNPVDFLECHEEMENIDEVSPHNLDSSVGGTIKDIMDNFEYFQQHQQQQANIISQLGDTFSDTDDMSTPSHSVPNTPIEESSTSSSSHPQNPHHGIDYHDYDPIGSSSHHHNIQSPFPEDDIALNSDIITSRPRRRKKNTESQSNVENRVITTPLLNTNENQHSSTSTTTTTTHQNPHHPGLPHGLSAGFEDDDIDDIDDGIDSSSDNGEDIVFHEASESSPSDFTQHHPADYYFSEGGSSIVDLSKSFSSSPFLIAHELTQIRNNLKMVRENATKKMLSNSCSTPVPGQTTSSMSSTSSQFYFNPYLSTIYYSSPDYSDMISSSYNMVYFDTPKPGKYSKKVIGEDFRNDEFLTQNTFSSDLKVVYAFEKLMVQSKEPVIHWGEKCSRCLKEDFLGPRFVCVTCSNLHNNSSKDDNHDTQNIDVMNLQLTEEEKRRLKIKRSRRMRRRKLVKKKKRKVIDDSEEECEGEEEDENELIKRLQDEDEEDEDEDIGVDYSKNDILFQIQKLKSGMDDDIEKEENRKMKKSNTLNRSKKVRKKPFSICICCYQKRIEFHPISHVFECNDRQSFDSTILEMKRLSDYFDAQRALGLFYQLKVVIGKLEGRRNVMILQETQMRMLELKEMIKKMEEETLRKKDEVIRLQLQHLRKEIEKTGVKEKFLSDVMDSPKDNDD